MIIEQNSESPLRFGQNTVNKSQLCQLIAKEMSSHRLESKSFLDALMGSTPFVGWFCLSDCDESSIQWFCSFATANKSEMNVVCQGGMRKLFSLLEDSFHGLNTGFEIALLNYLHSKDFKTFYETTLPEALRDNRVGASYLVDALRASFLE